MDDVLIIGIAGGTGSGKTTLTQRLANRLGSDATVMTHDDYYRAHDELTYEERTKLNYDHPDSYETELFASHLAELKSGHAIQRPVYDFSIHNRIDKTVEVRPSRVMIIEGILIFCDPALRGLMDMRVFVDADADLRILRRLRRDVNERGRTVQSVMDQYLTTVKPMHDQFVEPSKNYADIIVPGVGDNTIALDMLEGWVRARLNG